MKFKKIIILLSIPFFINSFSLANTATSEAENIVSEATCVHKDTTTSQVVAIQPANTQIEIIEDSNNGWKKIDFGYIDPIYKRYRR